MRKSNSEAMQWAIEDFGSADLNDSRRNNRLLITTARAHERPNGRISKVFERPRELHGAYDFMENRHVAPSALIESMGRGTAQRAAGLPFVYVAVDGSSLTLADHAKKKDFGHLGSGRTKGRGLKVITALAINPFGTPLGVIGQEWWARTENHRDKPAWKRAMRPTEEKEIRYWIATMEQASAQCAAVDVKPHFIIDREGDAHDLLLAIHRLEAAFTVRASWDRVVESSGKDKQYLRAAMAQSRLFSIETMAIPEGGKRKARTARMELRAQALKVRLRSKRTRKRTWIEVSAVWLREVGTTPPGEEPIDWLLYTSVPVASADDARLVVRTYAKRWRIEDFHRTWKTGACNIEQNQLRSADAVIKWAVINASVATRIERLKHLSREQPETPAQAELGDEEIRALVALAHSIRGQRERPPTTSLNLAEAVYWIARLGGYTGKSSGGPPGSITIGRGLERLMYAVAGARALREFERRGQ